MATERDTHRDFDLIHAQKALQRERARAAALSLYCDQETAEVALSYKPSLVVEHDLSEPPIEAAEELALLEDFLGREVYGGRRDIRVVKLLVADETVEIQVGTGFPYENTRVNDRVINPKEQMDYYSSVFLLHNDKGVGRLWVYPRVFENSSDTAIRKIVNIAPPKIYGAIVGVLASEFDPTKIAIKFDSGDHSEDIQRITSWDPRLTLVSHS